MGGSNMKTNKTMHTPWPLPLKMDCGRTFGMYVVVTNQGNHYATTYDPGAARMIVAAPELLNALKLAQDMLNNASIYGGASEVIRAAIAKAEGGR